CFLEQHPAEGVSEPCATRIDIEILVHLRRSAIGAQGVVWNDHARHLGHDKFWPLFTHEIGPASRNRPTGRAPEYGAADEVAEQAADISAGTATAPTEQSGQRLDDGLLDRDANKVGNDLVGHRAEH